MASPARRLSTKQLIKFLDIDTSLPDFIDVHSGNEANLAALFDRIAELKDKSPADYERLNAAAAGVENPDDMVEAIGREIYPPVASDGIRGKDPAATGAVEERVGAPTDKADATALAPVPAPKEPAPETAPAAKRGRGRPRKTQDANPEKKPAPKAAAPAAAALPEGGVGYVGGPTTSDVVSSGSDMPGTGFGSVGAFGDSVSLPGASPISQPPKFNPFAAVDWSKYGATGTPPPGSAPSPNQMSIDDQIAAMDALMAPTRPPQTSSPLDALTDNINPSGGAIGTYGPDPNDVLNPAGGSYGQYGPFDSFDPMSGIDASGGAGGAYGPPDPMTIGLNEAGGATGDFGPDLPPGFQREMPKDTSGPWQPTNSMAANFFKAMNAPGGERFMTVGTAPIDSSLDWAANHPRLTAAGLVGAGLGMTRLNQAPPNPYAATPEEEAQAKANLERSTQALIQGTKRGTPQIIPSER